jgi:hypothetical protein
MDNLMKRQIKLPIAVASCSVLIWSFSLDLSELNVYFVNQKLVK